MASQENHQASWQSSYPHLSGVINRLSLKTGVEVGVAFGGHSEYIMKNTGVERLYGVDRYRHDPGYADPMNLPQKEFDQVYQDVKNRLSAYGSRFELIREDSEKAGSLISEQIDFVYIDAEHSYEGVLKDIAVWFKKVRTGGIISGHDYRHPDFPGVSKAVDEYFSRFNWEVHDEGEGVWWVEKREVVLGVGQEVSDVVLESYDDYISIRKIPPGLDPFEAVNQLDLDAVLVGNSDDIDKESITSCVGRIRESASPIIFIRDVTQRNSEIGFIAFKNHMNGCEAGARGKTQKEKLLLLLLDAYLNRRLVMDGCALAQTLKVLSKSVIRDSSGNQSDMSLRIAKLLSECEGVSFLGKIQYKLVVGIHGNVLKTLAYRLPKIKKDRSWFSLVKKRIKKLIVRS